MKSLEKICPICNKIFKGKSLQICCSRECSNKRKYKEIFVKCEICGKEFDRQERDNYTCRKCGAKEYLATHHIENYSEKESLRTDINNGVTLCVECHKKFHKQYGNKNNNKEQIDMFLK